MAGVGAVQTLPPFRRRGGIAQRLAVDRVDKALIQQILHLNIAHGVGIVLLAAHRLKHVGMDPGIGATAAQSQQQHNRLQGDADVQYSGDEKPDSLQQSLKQFSHNFPPQKHGFAGQHKTVRQTRRLTLYDCFKLRRLSISSHSAEAPGTNPQGRPYRR